ncbi:DnaB-like helicase C-terminal domain-containing protein [Bradyrhizobium sp. Ai1a-2]|uniref:DnaB-like helicase C-terminal domain-containing protein n=1 Tax=Bradyrhizobium sp. Ai1a-2 TaxID=196490 RepID=UPI000489E50B|nr:DnaB-like helicase C-terminal domain-containing protein [Bradyrhizobium sp. Ai1a-2]
MSKKPAAHANRPTQNIRAEEAVIGKILGSAETFWAVSDRLTGDQFSVPHHRAIFKAVQECCEQGPGPSLSLLEAKLPTEFEGEGAVEAVLQILIEKASDVTNALDFVDDIILAWRERARIELGKVATAAGKTFDDTREDIDALLRVVDDHDRVRHAVRVGDAARAATEKAAEAFQHKGRRAVGVLTRIEEIDLAIGPQIGGTAITLAGASGHGKSGLLAQIFRNGAAASLDPSSVFPSLLISMEMSQIQNAYRNLASMTGISVRKQISGDFNQKEFMDLQSAKTSLDAMPIYVQDRGRLTIDEIEKEIRIAVRRYGIKQAGIDNLKLIRPSRDNWSLVQTIEEATARTKALAKELDIVIWQLAQLTRDGQKTGNWRFRAADIYGGGLVVENSDLVLGVAVPIVWLRENKPEPPSEANPRGREVFDKWLKDMEVLKHKAEFAAFKVRDGRGETWKEMDFDGPRMLFGGIDREPIPF